MKALATLLIIIASYLFISTIYSVLLCSFTDEIIIHGHYFDDGSFYYYGHAFFVSAFTLMIGIPTIFGWLSYKNLSTEKTSEIRLIAVSIIVIFISIVIGLPYYICGWVWTNFAISHWSSFR